LQTSFTLKIVYSLILAILVVMSLVFGIRAFWDGPEAGAKASFQTYVGDRADYHRDVFIATTAIGLAFVVVAVASHPRWEPLPLAFLLSGLGVMLYGLFVGLEDIGRNKEAFFAMAAASMTVVFGAGFWFLARPRPPD